MIWNILDDLKTKQTKRASIRPSFGSLMCLFFSLKNMLLRAELEINESEGLTNTQLFLLTSQKLVPAFGLLLRRGKERGTPFPCILALLFLFTRFTATAWLIPFVNSWLHILITLDFQLTMLTHTIGYAEHFGLYSSWCSSRKSFIQSPSNAGSTPPGP